MDPILELISKDGTYKPAELAAMLGMSEAQAAAKIDEYKQNGTLLGYQAIIDWEKAEAEHVLAFIELKVNPQPDRGFDKIAEYIYQFPEVQSLYLMSSGGYDLLLTIDGRTMKEVAFFVAKKLAPLDGVLSTSTHFVLKKYKYKGVVFKAPQPDERENCN